jgi:VWFA-related protein
LYDAIYLASNELMKKQQGRKALIILTDGVDRGSKESLNTAIEAAQRGDTEVYSIYFKGEHGGGGGGNSGNGGYPGGHHGGYPGGGGGYPGGGGGYPGGGGGYPRGGGGQPEPREDGKKILAQISGETGGRLFEVSKKETVDQIYATIEEELRSQYVLGYTPANHSQLKRALQQLTSILLQVTSAVNNRLRGEGCFGRRALSAVESGRIRQNFEEDVQAETTCAER